ncbi:MAG: bifunctional histidinol-phosphatase/imidazoleglycerol-phosphate dehydratase HisB [Bacteroidetes bacterium]|nr:bifunctional histidinol-phosphatase/imidazoleglycerol-phosphate dehydratase HisB [Bacteroidota bacterium]
MKKEPKRVLFIDRDGTLINEPADEQIDAFEKLTFYPKAITVMAKIAKNLDFELVMVTNQDGLGTDSYPENTFWPVQELVLKTFENEGVIFDEICIDRSFPHENLPTRKPGTGMLKPYFSDAYDLKNSYVIGDRMTDVVLANNLGCKAIYINNNPNLGKAELYEKQQNLAPLIALETQDWDDIYTLLAGGNRKAETHRKTNETDVTVQLNLDGTGKSDIQTGLPFFDHMLDQLARHGQMDIAIKTVGDLHVDEHHTIEDTAIALGETVAKALGDKRGIERYGFCLPMDDCLAQVAIDFGGRNWIEWQAQFTREKIGEMPTEMFFHFFKSFSDGAKANLNIKAEGTNEHHKIEAVFKAFAKAIKMAVKRDVEKLILPSTKGML